MSNKISLSVSYFVDEYFTTNRLADGTWATVSKRKIGRMDHKVIKECVYHNITESDAAKKVSQFSNQSDILFRHSFIFTPTKDVL